MKSNHTYSQRTLLSLVLSFGLCLLASPALRADDDPDYNHRRNIVGLWDVHYFAGATEIFHTYQQWHSDGLEFEVNSIAPGAMCQGIFKQGDDGRVKDFHVVFTYDAQGKVNGHIEETENVVVSPDGASYEGTANQKFFDLNGHQVGQGSLTVRATRITVH